MKKKLYEIQCQTEILSTEKVKEVLEKKEGKVLDYFWVLHDKDVLDDGTEKKPHIHLWVSLNVSRDADEVARWFGFPDNYNNPAGKPFQLLRPVKSWEASLLYAIHYNAPLKYQYDIGEVHSNFHYRDAVTRLKGKYDEKQRLEETLHLIYAGAITKYNVTDHISMQEYVKNASVFDKAFDYRALMENSADKDAKVIYIQGPPGVGKSVYAKEFCRERDLPYVELGSDSHPWDEYRGQPCAIWDDYRPGKAGSLAEFLGVLDNHTNRNVAARYHDKSLSQLKYLLITCPLTLEEVISSYRGKEKNEAYTEDERQLYRRVSYYLKMDQDTITVEVYNDETGKFELVGETANTLNETVTPLTVEEKKKNAIELFNLK